MHHPTEAAQVGGPWLQELLRDIFTGAWYMPHGHCYLWKPGLVWLHVVSDTLIGAAYFLISLVLYALVRRIRLPFSTMVVAFGVFIGACGLTHFMQVWNVWNSAYWLAGGVKALTAFASVLTGAYLVKARPAIVQVAEAARLSEQRRVELEIKNRELEALYSRLREADELKTRFFANVSHELRTPLSLIIGPMERLLATEGLAADRKQDLQVVERNARLLLRHVNALLDAAKLEAEAMVPAYAEVDLAVLVRLGASNFDSLARDRGLTFQVDAPGQLAAQADAEKLERVLINLLSNAFKFTPEGGRVSCALQGLDGRARLVVEDTGPGVPEHMRELIFERFRQVDSGINRQFGGTGLGLAIARDFVRLHGGTLRLEEPPGGGARFVMELPLRAPEGTTVRSEPLVAARELAAEAAVAVEELRTQTLAGTAPASQATATAPLVLVVEDTPDLRQFVAQTLGREFRVEVAQDGVEGLRKAEALRPDVLVTDIMMPRMSGDVLVREVRSQVALEDMPILLLSARADDALRVRLLSGGAQDYLVKPFLAAELVARVRNLAMIKRTREALQQELQARSGNLETLAQELAMRKRQLEAALEAAQAARAEAQKASEFKTTLLRLISHELRTPLSSVQLNLHLLMREQEALSARHQGLLEKLTRGTTRLHHLTETVLEYSRLEAGRLVLSLSEVDLVALAREVVEEYRPEAQRKLLALELRLPAEPAVARTDPRLLQLVLINLVSNAVKYTDQGSVELSVEAVTDTYRIAVKDTGRGIDPAHHERIFEPFEQLEDLHRKGTPGLGLGLVLVKELSILLGAQVVIVSAVGQGSTFIVTLPISGARSG
ncbi:MAG TPA: ATP-binding protein [Myxococcaceae bacterium]|nr:ATP-binding protein [Myxococcaceae bacterium]